MFAALGSLEVYIHANRVIHRDIKPANMVLSQLDPDVVFQNAFAIDKKSGRRHPFNS